MVQLELPCRVWLHTFKKCTMTSCSLRLKFFFSFYLSLCRKIHYIDQQFGALRLLHCEKNTNYICSPCWWILERYKSTRLQLKLFYRGTQNKKKSRNKKFSLPIGQWRVRLVSSSSAAGKHCVCRVVRIMAKRNITEDQQQLNDHFTTTKKMHMMWSRMKMHEKRKKKRQLKRRKVQTVTWLGNWFKMCAYTHFNLKCDVLPKRREVAIINGYQVHVACFVCCDK